MALPGFVIVAIESVRGHAPRLRAEER
jgi:hypothetical protein